MRLWHGTVLIAAIAASLAVIRRDPTHPIVTPALLIAWCSAGVGFGVRGIDGICRRIRLASGLSLWALVPIFWIVWFGVGIMLVMDVLLFAYLAWTLLP